MNNQQSIRVMIVDDHAVVRSGLAAFLLAFDDLTLVAEASGGQEALALCHQHHLDVILMDLVMPGLDGAETTHRIRSEYPHIQVVALTSFKEDELIQGALRAGAISYLLKNVTADELAAAIRAAYIGRSTLAPEATAALIHAATQLPKPSYELTGREREILSLMVQGLNNPDIAIHLTVSRSTVKFHVSNILSKLGVSGRTEAVALALQENLVT